MCSETEHDGPSQGRGWTPRAGQGPHGPGRWLIPGFLAALLSLVVTLGACIPSDFTPSGYRCGAFDDCIPGYACVAGRCVDSELAVEADGGPGEAGGDGGSADQPGDLGPGDAGPPEEGAGNFCKPIFLLRFSGVWSGQIQKIGSSAVLPFALVIKQHKETDGIEGGLGPVADQSLLLVNKRTKGLRVDLDLADYGPGGRLRKVGTAWFGRSPDGRYRGKVVVDLPAPRTEYAITVTLMKACLTKLSMAGTYELLLAERFTRDLNGGAEVPGGRSLDARGRMTLGRRGEARLEISGNVPNPDFDLSSLAHVGFYETGYTNPGGGRPPYAILVTFDARVDRRQLMPWHLVYDPASRHAVLEIDLATVGTKKHYIRLVFLFKPGG